jgi:hypothetical protein
VNDRPIHDRMEELFAAESVGGLDEDGRRELGEAMMWHDPRCPECGAFRIAYAEVAASLAMSLEPVPPAAGAEDRLLEAARSVAQGRPAFSVTRLDEADSTRGKAGGRRSPLRVAAVALAAAACLFAAGVLGYAVRGPSASPVAVAALFAAQGGTRSVTLQSGAQRVVVYYRPGQPAALLVGTGLDAPPAGRVYELWYLPAGATDMAPAGIFSPQEGSVVAPATLTTPFTTLAVSVEPHYVTSPTGTVVMVTPPKSS